jgi:hypothetical protein
MFDIEVCEAKRISLVRFRGELSAQDFAELDRLAVESRDVASGIHSIYDLTDVTVNALVTDFVARRGQLPQTFKGYERVYVVPQEVLRRLVRLYIDFQRAHGERPPMLVTTLDEALRHLGVERSEFRSLIGAPTPPRR